MITSKIACRIARVSNASSIIAYADDGQKRVGRQFAALLVRRLKRGVA